MTQEAKGRQPVELGDRKAARLAWWLWAACLALLALALMGAALAALADGFYPGLLATHGYVENPLEATGALGQQLTKYGSLAGSKIFASALLLVCTVAALFSPVVRLRRTRGDASQQLKWFLYAAVPAAFLLSAYLVEVMFGNYTMESMFETMYKFDMFEKSDAFSSHAVAASDIFSATSYVPAFALLLLAVFACIAILRYRLYDIDLLRPPHQPHPRLRLPHLLRRRDLHARGGRARGALSGAGQPRHLCGGHTGTTTSTAVWTSSASRAGSHDPTSACVGPAAGRPGPRRPR